MTRKMAYEIITLPKIKDFRGNLSYVEQLTHLPFKITSIQWYFDVPSEKEMFLVEGTQVIIALSGNIDISLEKSEETKEFRLNSPGKALLIRDDSLNIKATFASNSVLVRIV